jgi:hypothetical protein
VIAGSLTPGGAVDWLPAITRLTICGPDETNVRSR